MNLQKFDFKFWPVRVVEIEGEPWFLAKDICDVLEIQNVTQALNKMDDDERAMFNIGRQGDTNFVNESGFYSLVLSSRKPEAKKFKKWVTSEVLPEIRKHGGYLTPKKTEEILSNPDLIISLAMELKRERQEKATLKVFMQQKNELIHSLSADSKYLREVIEADGELLITEVSKEMGMSGSQLNKLLMEWNVIYKIGPSYVLYAQYQNRELTKTRTSTYVDSGGNTVATWQLVWTQKGRRFIREMYDRKRAF